MKSKIKIITIIYTMVMCAGCSKDKETNYNDLIQGIWVNTVTNGNATITDKVFVVEFNNGKEYYSTGIQMDSNNATWINKMVNSYVVTGNQIEISGTTDMGLSLELTLDVSEIDHNTLLYSIKKYVIGGSTITDDNIYEFARVTEDLHADITGTWYGKSTDANNMDTDYHYWEYFDDGTFDYYYRTSPDSDQWIKKENNEGKYWLYGDFMATSYTNDLINGTMGHNYECWHIDIASNTMEWTGNREVGHIAAYTMIKVNGPPDIK